VAAGGQANACRLREIAVAFLLAMLNCVLIAFAQIAPTHGRAPSNTRGTKSAAAERADELLKQMSAYIGSADQFTFHADITFGHVLPCEQKLQYVAVEDVALRTLKPRRMS
jgi:hypothetical protein